MPRPRGSVDRAKRTAVLAAAQEMVASAGQGATVSAIARRAGVSRQTIYNQFEDRATLLRLAAGQEAGRPCPACPAPGGQDPVICLSRYAEAVATWADRRIHVQSVWEGGESLPPEQSSRAQAVQALSAYLDAETRGGRLHVGSPHRAAEIFLDLMVGAPLLSRGAEPEEPQPEGLRRLAADYAAWFLEAWTRRDAPPASPRPGPQARPPAAFAATRTTGGALA